MKKIALSLIALSLAGSAFGMSNGPSKIPDGTDVIARAELDALTARYNCALPHFVPGAAKTIFTATYNKAVSAFGAQNRAAFDAYANNIAASIAQSKIAC